MTTTKPTIEHARRILDLLKHGLVSGLGTQKPGEMCVEALVCFVFDLPHGDNPPCVGEAVRQFKMRLNDCAWPSNHHRAKGMERLALAQLGSNELDQMEFGKRMFLRGTQEILPFVWRKEAERITKPEDKAEMLSWADKCKAATTFEQAQKLTKDASAYASAYASASASAYASASASASAYAYAYSHELLKLTAQVGVDVLIEMKSPGCKWLYLCDEKEAA